MSTTITLNNRHRKRMLIFAGVLTIFALWIMVTVRHMDTHDVVSSTPTSFAPRSHDPDISLYGTITDARSAGANQALVTLDTTHARKAFGDHQEVSVSGVSVECVRTFPKHELPLIDVVCITDPPGSDDYADAPSN